MILIDFERILMWTVLLADQSRRTYFHQKKVPEMEFSDKADIENAQACCPTPSGLRDRVAGRSSEIGQICSYLFFFQCGLHIRACHQVDIQIPEGL